MKYKALISDIDGTLILQGSKGTMNGFPSKRVADAISKAKDKIHIGLATSRPYEYTFHILDYLTLSAPCIILDGSVIIDSNSKKVLWEKTISLASVSFIRNLINTRTLVFNAFSQEFKNIQDTHAFLSQPLYNIFLAELTEKQVLELYDELTQLKDIAIHKVPSFTKSLWGLNVTDIHASKQHGVLQVAKILNIDPLEIIGIGDGYNDFPLLMACGLKIAMGNAVEDLKAIADYIAPTVENDGLADVIEKFVLTQ